MKITIELDDREGSPILLKLLTDLAAYEKESNEKEAREILDGLNQKEGQEESYIKRSFISIEKYLSLKRKRSEGCQKEILEMLKTIEVTENDDKILREFKIQFASENIKRIRQIIDAGGLNF